LSYIDETESAVTCDWTEYWIQDPLIKKSFSNYAKNGSYLMSTCDIKQPSGNENADSTIIYENPDASTNNEVIQ